MNISRNFNEAANKWITSDGIADQIKQADQNTIRTIFDRGSNICYCYEGFETILKIRAMRDGIVARLNGESEPTSPAQLLLERANKFNPRLHFVSSTMASFYSDIIDYYKSLPRHPDERFIRAIDLDRTTDMMTFKQSHLSAAAFFGSYSKDEWQLQKNGKMACRVSPSPLNYLFPFLDLTQEYDALRKTFNRSNQMGVKAKIHVELGETIGQDCVVVSISKNDHSKIYAMLESQKKEADDRHRLNPNFWQRLLNTFR